MSELSLKSVDDLLERNFFIPSYQRGYRWGEIQLKDLLEDLYEFWESEKSEGAFYCLQPIVVKKCDEETKDSYGLQSDFDNNTWYEVIDGQQRLISIYLLFKCITDADPNLKKGVGKDLFNIFYETHNKNHNASIDYIGNPSEPDDSSPSAFFITNGYKSIKELLSERLSETRIREYRPWALQRNLLQLLTNTKDVKKANGYVQVIWYDTDDPDPIEIFTRLNIGKIPLKNAELIKALFVQKHGETEPSNIQQIQIAKEWDQIEARLQESSIWAFLNKGLPDTPTHIEFIFDTIYEIEKCREVERRAGSQPKKKDREKIEKSVEKYFADKYGSDEYATFRFFSDHFEEAYRERLKKASEDDKREVIEEEVKKEVIEEEWEKIHDYFETFVDWYDTSKWYHYVGFLVYMGKSIVDIYHLYEGKTKEEFENSLVEAIKRELNVKLKCYGEGENDKDIEYNNKPVVFGNRPLMRSILLLYNIESIIQQNKEADDIYFRFPFDLYKSEKWDIEHVDSFTPNPLEEDKQRKEWLKANLDFLESSGIISSDEEINTDRDPAVLSKEEREKLKEFRKEPLTPTTRITDEKFGEISEIVRKLAGELTDADIDGDIDGDIRNRIGNLTLLNADINRGYGNAIYPLKRSEIIKKDAEGRFIPIGTKKVFLKVFTGIKFTPFWNKDDMEEYKADIIKVLDKFLDHEGMED